MAKPLKKAQRGSTGAEQSKVARRAARNRASTTVRVSPETRERLARLSAAHGLSTPGLIEALSLRAEDDALLQQMNDHYAELKTDEAAWDEYRRERESWDATLLDGLERE